MNNDDDTLPEFAVITVKSPESILYSILYPVIAVTFPVISGASHEMIIEVWEIGNASRFVGLSGKRFSAYAIWMDAIQSTNSILKIIFSFNL